MISNTRCIAPFALFAASVILAFSQASYAQNIVTNPSFELGTFTNRGDGFQILPVGSIVLPGWTVTNDSLAWGIFPNSAQGVSEISPRDGSYFLDLQSDGVFGAPYGGVTQSLTTVIGQRYHFSFNLGTQENPSSPLTHGPVSVSASAGPLTMPFTFSPEGTNTQWGEFGFDFTASSTSTPISIIGTLTTGGAYIGLDFVSVVLLPNASPCDLNGDGAVDAADAGIMFSDWGASPGSPADKNRDGLVDAADAGTMFEEWTGDARPTSVPEPSTSVLVVSLLLGAFSVRRKVGE